MNWGQFIAILLTMNLTAVSLAYERSWNDQTMTAQALAPRLSSMIHPNRLALILIPLLGGTAFASLASGQVLPHQLPFVPGNDYLHEYDGLWWNIWAFFQLMTQPTLRLLFYFQDSRYQRQHPSTITNPLDPYLAHEEEDLRTGA